MVTEIFLDENEEFNYACKQHIYSDYGQLSALHSSQLPGTICPT